MSIAALRWESPRPVQGILEPAALEDLDVVTELLGVPRYEFVGRAVKAAVDGHLRVVSRRPNAQAKQALVQAKAVCRSRRKTRQLRAKPALRVFQAWLADEKREAKLRDRIARLGEQYRAKQERRKRRKRRKETGE